MAKYYEVLSFIKNKSITFIKLLFWIIFLLVVKWDYDFATNQTLHLGCTVPTQYMALFIFLIIPALPYLWARRAERILRTIEEQEKDNNQENKPV